MTDFKISPNSVLEPHDVHEIKMAMWNGMPVRALARQKRVAIGTIQAIRDGFTWKFIPWPDGSLGALSQTRKDELHTRRREEHWNNKNASQKAVQAINLEYDKKVEIVNAVFRRVEQGKDPLTDRLKETFDEILPFDWRAKLEKAKQPEPEPVLETTAQRCEKFLDEAIADIETLTPDRAILLDANMPGWRERLPKSSL